MNKILILLLFVFGFITVNAQNPVIINQPYDFQKWVNVKSALQFPAGCGIPFGTASLNGGDHKKPAIYRDTCGKKTYIFEPSDSTWAEVGSGTTLSQQSITGTGATGDKLRLLNDISSTPALGKEHYYSWDSTGTRGYNEQKYVIAKKMSELRSLRSADTAKIYRSIVNGKVADFYWSPADTTIDDSVMVIKLNGTTTGRLLRYFNKYISVDWFGAIPNDGNDDSYAIQKAINFAITNSKAPEVIFSGGQYLANDINIVKKSGSEYSFVTLKISGSSFLVGNATTISVNNANGFGLHIMIGRQVEIENITFVGNSPNPATIGSVITWTRSQWATGVRDNIHSPHAAIVIDGYHNSITSGDQYPGMSAYYSNSGTGGTSQLTIRNCTFKRFVTAIIEGAAGAVANGDNIKAQDCYFEANRVAWACGQTQSRANTIENCYFLFHQFIINGIDYGSQVGTPPNVKRCNLAGATKYLYATNGTFGGLTFQECYSESLFSLGKCQSPVQFTDCELILNTDPNVGFQPRRVAEGSQVSFKGGRLGYFDNVSKMAMAFNVTNLSFNGVTLLCLPLNINSNIFDAAASKTVFDNCQFIGSGQTGDAWESNTVNTTNYQATFSNSPVFMPGYKAIFDDGNKRIQVESKSPKIEFWQFDGPKQINIDTPTATAYFISSAPAAYQLYDVLTIYDNTSWSGDNSLYTAGGTILGQIYAINSDTIRVKYVPFGLDETTNYSILLARVPHFFPRCFGDLTSGSNTINNMHYPYWQPLVGDWIKGSGLPDGTRITAISGSTITISMNATSTLSGVEFYDAKLYTEVRTRDISLATMPLGFSKGDIIINTREISVNDSIAYWICSVPGSIGGTPAADFTYVKTAQAPVNVVMDQYNIDAQYTDVNNSGTSATDLYSKTVSANQFLSNGNKIYFDTHGITNDATATVNLEVLFAGNGIAGTGPITISTTGIWHIRGYVIRTGSTTARAYAEVTIDGAPLAVYQASSLLTGLDFTVTNVLKVRATAGGAGGGSNDITGQAWIVDFHK